VIGCQLGAADMWSNLFVVIMDGEDAQGAAGRAGVLNPGGFVGCPAEDALQVMYVAGRYHVCTFVLDFVGDEGDARVAQRHQPKDKPMRADQSAVRAINRHLLGAMNCAPTSSGLVDYFEFDSG
jgi:hypothetical protein